MTDPSVTPGLPRELGYRLPAEWEPHAATWLTWPRREGISFPAGFDAIPALWARMVAALAPGEEVHLNTFDDPHRDEITAVLKEHGLGDLIGRRVFLHPFPAYEPWCRDHGPVFVRNDDGLAIVDWEYNAWGGKYPPYDLDNEIPRRVAEHLDLPRFVPDMVLEGGSIDVDGAGTLLTTASCLLHPNRNPGRSQAEIETALRDYLGVEKILWLGAGIAGDDTDGHLDDLTRFIAPGTVVTAVENDPADENHAPLRANRDLLATMTDARGEPLRVLELPMPEPLAWNGGRLPASYANFYIGNEVVLLPVFDQPTDEQARNVLQEGFPTRQVVGIMATDLINGLGACHCVTQQQPLASPRPEPTS